MGFINKFLKLRRNREFDYRPRYYKGDKEGNPYKIEYKFDQFRSTVGSNRGLKTKFNNVLADSKRAGDRNMRLRLVSIVLVLTLVFLYIIDFDLSIFLGN